MSQPPLVFINYRISDTADVANSLARALEERFGEGSVFIGERDIPAGKPWPDTIRANVTRAAAVLCLIGEHWLRAQNEHGRRRLDENEDWVRLEIEEALKVDEKLLLVLVNGAKEPSPAALDNLQTLSRLPKIQAIELRRRDWEHDLDRIIALLATRGFSGHPPTVPEGLPDLDAMARRARSTIQRTFRCDFRRFHGRENDQRNLLRLILGDPRSAGVIIGAIGGMGKTALANHFCTSSGIEKRFQVVVGASAKESALNVTPFRPNAHALSVPDAVRTTRDYLLAVSAQLGIRDSGARSDERLAENIRSAIDGKSALFLIDNLETLRGTSAALELLGRLCSPPDQKFLVTARDVPDTLPGVYPLRLRRLEAAGATALVQDLLEDLDAGSLMSDARAIEEVVRRGDGHPLALRHLTGKLWALGANAIREMPEALRPVENEGWGTFFSFIFDEALLSTLGAIAVDVAHVIASYEHGVTLEALIWSCQAIDTEISRGLVEDAVHRLERAFCIYREQDQDKGESVLTMHSLTREFFKSFDSEEGDS